MGELSKQQVETVDSVLATMIPASEDGRLPSAGELGLAEGILAALGDAGCAAMADTLAALDARAATHGGGGFSALGAAERETVLREFDATDPGFVGGLLLPVYVAYYQHSRVQEGLGREPRPPFPKGYEVAPFDPKVVEAVRARPKPWREA